MPRARSVVVVLMLLAPVTAVAGNLSAQMPVRLTMVGNCQSVSVTAMDFGVQRYQDRPAEVNAQARVTVTCSQGAQYSIDIDNGRDPGEGRARHLRGDFTRRYDLYRDAAGTQPWGSGQQGGSALTQVMGSAGVASHTVYGKVRIPASGQLGEATDTVTVTLSY